MYYYNARWYDPALGRFIQPDTIVPNPADVQAFDRYAYVNNNPLKYTDPTGHAGCAVGLPCSGAPEFNQALQQLKQAVDSAGPYGLEVALVGGGALVVGMGTAYGVLWAIEDPLPNVPPLFPDANLGDGNISITIPVPGSTTVTSGVPLIPSLETGDPGISVVETPGLNIVESNTGTSGGSRSGKDFTRKGKREVIEANQAAHGGVTTCEECGRVLVPAQQSQKGVTPPDNEIHVDHKHPRSKGGDGAPSNGQGLCRVCNLKKSNH